MRAKLEEKDADPALLAETPSDDALFTGWLFDTELATEVIPDDAVLPEAIPLLGPDDVVPTPEILTLLEAVLDGSDDGENEGAVELPRETEMREVTTTLGALDPDDGAIELYGVLSDAVPFPTVALTAATDKVALVIAEVCVFVEGLFNEEVNVIWENKGLKSATDSVSKNSVLTDDAEAKLDVICAVELFS